MKKRMFPVFLLSAILGLSIPISTSAQNESTQSLDQRKMLINKALEKSYLVKNQQLEVRKDELDKLKIYQTYLPNVSFNSTYTRLNDDIKFVVPAISIPPIKLSPVAPALQLPAMKMPPMILQEKNIWKSDITASMVLFTGFKAPFMIKAVSHKKKADEAMIQRNVTDVIIEVSDCYDKLSLLAQSLQLLNESQLRLDAENKFAQKAFQQGLITAYDLSKIDIATQEIDAKRIELEASKKLVVTRLVELTGLDKNNIESVQPSLNVWSSEVPVSESSIAERPEAKALQEAIAGTEDKYKATISGYVPTVYSFCKRELRKEDLSAFDPLWLVGVGLRWNLFDGGQNYRDIQKAKIDIDITKNTYENTLMMLNMGLEKAKNDLLFANQMIEVAQKRKITANKGLDLAIKQYELGLVNITERIAAEVDIQKAELDYCQAVYKQRMANLSLLQASGQVSIENIR